MSEQIGVIGLGAMGAIFARHLMAEGYDVVGFDTNPDQMASLRDAGMTAAASPKEVADRAEIIISSLPSAAAVDAVISGEDGILQSQALANILIETSTLKISDKIAFHDAMAAGGKEFLDTPISGTPPMVENKTSSLYVSGGKTAYERCVYVLEAFAGANDYVGEVGNGMKMKILANYLVAVHTVAAAECMVFGMKAGLDPKMIHEVLPKGAGGSIMLQVRGEYMANSDYRYEDGTIFNIIRKDLSIISEYAAELNAPIHQLAAARQTFNSAVALGLDHLELAAVCRAVETAAGVEREMVE